MSDPVQYHEAKGLLLSSSTPGAEPLNQQDRRVGHRHSVTKCQILEDIDLVDHYR